MAQLSTPFDSPERSGLSVAVALAAAAVAYPGGILALNSSGYAVPANDATGLTVVGRCEIFMDNTLGADGDLSTVAKRGVFRYLNSATNAVAETDIGKVCYIEGDSIVASTSTYKIPAGVVVDVDPDGSGVWVDMTRIPAAPAALSLTAATVTTAAATDLTTSEALANSLKTQLNATIVDVAAIKTLLQSRGIAL